ncbi:MAG: molybdate ABC transporter substrate-binding protein [Lautropia sp.]
MCIVARLTTAVVALALPFAAAAQQITVSAAASLTDAFKEIGSRFEADQKGATVRFNFAASGVLLQQISQGAPVDVFASADQDTMNRAAQQNLIVPATRKDFAMNQVVLIEPAKEGTGIKDLQGLAGAGVKRIAVGKVGTVPVGRYTKEVLDTAGMWSKLEPKFVFADSVRQVLDYVGRGEVEAGFVYATDAAVMRDRVKVVLTATGHTPVSYPVAVIADSKQKEIAGKFVQYLSSGRGIEILTKYGFAVAK